MAREIAKAYEPQQIEPRWAEFWIQDALFRADSAAPGPVFSIAIPPPNVTGSLHIGHMLDHTEIDILTRWHRMRGFNTLYLPGTDHAGISTQRVVVKQLADQGIDYRSLGRDEFEKRVWQWKEESGGTITRQMRQIGETCDWSREKFTLSPELSRVVREVFVRLYEEGLIYRAHYLINWCPSCLTALSDLETVHEDRQGHLWHIRYPVAGTNEHLVVATTRPETMLGDTAVAVHPEDERYKHLVGKTILLPLAQREIPVIADAMVDREFGTGAVKITPAHDPNDFEAGRRHHLPEINVMTDNGHMNAAAGPYAGLDRFAARKRVVEDLQSLGLLEKITDHAHAIAQCERCKTVVEPRASTQWFCKMKPLAEPAIAAVETGEIRMVPDNRREEYFNWMRNIRDWCISRQLWWGHRIPVFYCDACGEIIVAREDPKECPKCHGAKLHQDEDILDTWFSSALWPFSTLGWPDETQDLKKFYPTSVLVTGYDILFFWVARMMMFGLFAMDNIPPFHVISLHGLVRDKFGKKMSKSRGNSIDPLEFMDMYGTDAMRFTLARGANPGSDQALAEEWVAGSRNFATKLWNATRFAIMNGANVSGELPDFNSLNAIDRWILSRLNSTIAEVDALFESYDYARACEIIYHFAWDDLCDWYLELSKEAFATGTAHNSKRVLGYVLDQLLRIMHPVMPFVTEELWTTLTGGESLVIAQWPKPNPSHHDTDGEKLILQVQEIITEVRRFRNDQGIKPSQRIPGQFHAPEEFARYERAMRFVLRVDHPEEGLFTPSQTLEIGKFKIELDLSQSVDVVAERARLSKDLATAKKDRETAIVKLSNDGFMAKAPESVVVEIKERLAKTDSDIERLSAALDGLPSA